LTTQDVDQEDFRLQRRLAARVGSVVHLRRVGLTGLTFTVDDDFSLSDQLVVNLTYGHGWQRLSEVVVDVQLEDAVSAGLHIKAEHVLAYVVPAGIELSDDELTSFAVVSGTFAVHPYVREVVQSVTTRAGLPAVVLDVWRSPLDVDNSDG
jgi:preprotein translocase subunit SecB